MRPALALLPLLGLLAPGARDGGTPLGPILDLPSASAPPQLPPPLPPPDALEQPADAGSGNVPPPPDDPLEFLYAHRLNFAAGGTPLVTIRLMEGQARLEMVGEGPLSVTVQGAGAKQIGVPPGTTLSLRLGESQAGRLSYHAQVADLEFRDKDGVAREREHWLARGYAVELRTLGTVYGIAGRVIDNRRTLLLVGPAEDQPGAQALASELRRKYGTAAVLQEDLVARPHGVIQVADGAGGVVAVSQDLVIVDPGPRDATLVKRVEYGVGYAFHGFEDRRYRGRLFATIDKGGKLALIEALPLEELLRGLVPKEIFAAAPPEALKAQAVTARGEVLAKIGARHLADPYLLCAEQHCQVYGGLGGERASTDRAVAETRGEALFSKAGMLVDSVYSAVCGGHTEDNETVWGGPPDPSLRGVSDLLEGDAREPGRSDVRLRRWVSADPPAYCKLSGMAAPGKFRWVRRFTAAEVDAAFESFGIGRILALRPIERGSSGRAAALAIVGEKGEAELRGELAIRRRLGNLNSSAFVVDVDAGPDGTPQAFVLRGAGWGHGVGMCQTGAIGRAQRGQSYRDILSHYFGGAEITRIY